MVNHVYFGDRKVGKGEPCFIIAEAGVNHNGNLEMAIQLIETAVEAGADAVKFQTFDADRLATADAPKAEYQLRTTGAAESQLEMLRSLQLSREDHNVLKSKCVEQGILFMSSPFDEESVELLAELDVAVFKVPSGEINNLPYLSLMASKGKPMIVSTGMASMNEVAEAVNVISNSGDPGVVLLQCVSNYPANPADVNLNAMTTMSDAFGVPTGFSDHTLGLSVTSAAVALGATVIEKHFTLDRTLPGPDHPASLEPYELTEMVRAIRTVESALGDGRKEPAPSETNTAAVVRKSLVARKDIAAGTTLDQSNVSARRPGTGLSPALMPKIIGRVAKVRISEGQIIDFEMLN